MDGQEASAAAGDQSLHQTSVLAPESVLHASARDSEFYVSADDSGEEENEQAGVYVDMAGQADDYHDDEKGEGEGGGGGGGGEEEDSLSDMSSQEDFNTYYSAAAYSTATPASSVITGPSGSAMRFSRPDKLRSPMSTSASVPGRFRTTPKRRKRSAASDRSLGHGSHAAEPFPREGVDSSRQPARVPAGWGTALRGPDHNAAITVEGPVLVHSAAEGVDVERFAVVQPVYGLYLFLDRVSARSWRRAPRSTLYELELAVPARNLRAESGGASQRHRGGHVIWVWNDAEEGEEDASQRPPDEACIEITIPLDEDATAWLHALQAARPAALYVEACRDRGVRPVPSFMQALFVNPPLTAITPLPSPPGPTFAPGDCFALGELLRASPRIVTLKLESLGLHDDCVTAATLERGLRATAHSLQGLSLAHNKLGDAAMRSVSSALTTFPGVGGDVSGTGALGLRTLSVADNAMTDAGAMAVQSLVRHCPALQDLDVADNPHVTGTGIAALVHATQASCARLRRFAASRCSFGMSSPGAHRATGALARALPEWQQLSHLELCGCQITDETLRPLATAVVAHCLDADANLALLDLRENFIQAPGDFVESLRAYYDARSSGVALESVVLVNPQRPLPEGLEGHITFLDAESRIQAPAVSDGSPLAIAAMAAREGPEADSRRTLLLLRITAQAETGHRAPDQRIIETLGRVAAGPGGAMGFSPVPSGNADVGNGAHASPTPRSLHSIRVVASDTHLLMLELPARDAHRIVLAHQSGDQRMQLLRIEGANLVDSSPRPSRVRVVSPRHEGSPAPRRLPPSPPPTPAPPPLLAPS